MEKRGGKGWIFLGKVLKSRFPSAFFLLESLGTLGCGKPEITVFPFRSFPKSSSFSTVCMVFCLQFGFSDLLFGRDLDLSFRKGKKFSTIVHRFSRSFPSGFRFLKAPESLMESRFAEFSAISAGPTAPSSVKSFYSFYSSMRVEWKKNRFALCAKKRPWGVAPNPNRFLKKAVQKLLVIF